MVVLLPLLNSIFIRIRVCWIGFILCDSQRQRQLAAHITWKRRIFHVCYISVWSSLCYARTYSLLEFSSHLALSLSLSLFLSLSRSRSLSFSVAMSLIRSKLFVGLIGHIWTIYEHNRRNSNKICIYIYFFFRCCCCCHCFFRIRSRKERSNKSYTKK